MSAIREIKIDLDKPFGTNPFWERLLGRFARGDIIRFDYGYVYIKGIYWGSYKLTEEQIHVQMIGKLNAFGESKIGLQEFLLAEGMWRHATLIKSSTEFRNLREVIAFWQEMKHGKEV